jgi:ectoine hydroxylase-related dioxygenase (phytanoyl-CoA dioxygenase family)
MAAGSVLVWDRAMIHGSGANTTKDRLRRTLSFNHGRGWLRTQYNQYLSVPRGTILSMPPDLQRDLGYQLRARGLGACDNQHPLVYLQRLTAAGGDGAQATLGPVSHPSRFHKP